MDLVGEIWKDLKSLGFSGSVRTFPDLFSWLRKIKLVHSIPHLRKINDTTYATADTKLSEFATVMNGKFGILFLVYHETVSSNGYVYLKASPDYPNSLLLEGILQNMAHTTLRLYGFPTAVPRVLNIVKHPNYGIVFTVERIAQAQLFADYLKNGIQWGEPSETNDKLVLSVIAQVATYVAILEVNLGLNHRDLKSTNVLMIAPSNPWKHTILLDSYSWTLTANNHAILIDFGFSCIGKATGQTIVSAGEHLPTFDFCPKQGRDLFLLFSSLWNVEAFRNSVSEKMHGLFRKWLQDTTTTNWADWLATAAQTNMASMYLLTNSDNFKSKHSAPIQVLSDISEVYPELIHFEKIRRSATPVPIV